MKRSNPSLLFVVAVMSSVLATSCGDDVSGTSAACGSCTDTQTCVNGVCIDTARVCGEAICDEGESCVAGACVSNGALCGGLVCTETQTCVDGTCVANGALCGGLVCTETQTCVDGTCVNNHALCGGVQCTGTQTCLEDRCIDTDKICGDVVCDGEESCVDGVCVRTDTLCNGVVCKEGYACVDEVCEKTDPCVDVHCLEGKACLLGNCLDEACIVDGAEKVCGENEMCVGGECVDDGCLVDGNLMVCADGYECVKGVCEESLCIGKICGQGTSCVAGNCIDNECLDVTCDAGNTCVKGECIDDDCLDVTCTRGKICMEDGSCQFPDAPALSVAENEHTSTDENGGSLQFQVSLNHEPSAEVKLICTIEPESAADEAEVECGSFLPENWSDAQTVIVTGQPDEFKDGDQSYSVVIKTQSEDPEFDGLELDPIELTNVDTNTAELLVEFEDNNRITSENGDCVFLNLSLSSKPTDDVCLDISIDKWDEGTFDGAGIDGVGVCFSPERWSHKQRMAVCGEDDDEADGSQTYHIVIDPLMSVDPNYSGLKPEPIELVNQDNDTAGVTISSQTVETDENGKSSELTFKLNTKPTSDVILTLTVSDETEAKPSVKTLTISPAQWNVGVKASIIGVADNMIDGDQEYTVSVSFDSADPNYKLSDQFIKGINVDIDKAAFGVSLNGAPTVYESGTSVTASVTLKSIPTGNVEVALASKDTTEVKVSPAKLTFTPSNWNVGQTITMTGVDDHVIDGNVESVVALTVSSSDAHYDKLASEIKVTTVDDDAASIVVKSESATISEKGGSTTMSVSLAAQPESDVTITLKSSDASELVPAVSTITFTASNWNVAQTVILNAVDDSLADGTQTAYVTLTSSSADGNFNGLKAQSAVYSISDNETAGVVVSTTSLELKPSGYTGTFNVKLSVEPVSDVTVNLATTNSATASLSATSLKFTSSTWNTPQTVTVKSTSPMSASAAITKETITSKAASTGVYNGVKGADVNVKIYAFESESFAAPSTCTAYTRTLLPGKYKLQVWGASGGDEVSFSQTTASHAGFGGYSEGIVTLTKKTNVWVNIGKQGTKGSGAGTAGGGCNGGGNAGVASNGATAYGGGGGTDIRLEENTLYHRVIVAGGGGGADNGGGTLNGSDDGSGGYGGGAEGQKGRTDGALVIAAGTQTSGYQFGVGQSCTIVYDLGGGGGGWYGGRAATSSGTSGGGGGSGFVFPSTATVPTGYKLSSAYYLTSTKLLNGGTSFASPSGTTETGHKGNGYAIISIVE